MCKIILLRHEINSFLAKICANHIFIQELPRLSPAKFKVKSEPLQNNLFNSYLLSNNNSLFNYTHDFGLNAMIVSSQYDYQGIISLKHNLVNKSFCPLLSLKHNLVNKRSWPLLWKRIRWSWTCLKSLIWMFLSKSLRTRPQSPNSLLRLLIKFD